MLAASCGTCWRPRTTSWSRRRPARRGWRSLERERPDLILMDIQLPGIDGYEVTRRIKANPALSHIPIIAVTSYALSGDDKKAFAAGCDGYVTKPCSPRAAAGEDRRVFAVG